MISANLIHDFDLKDAALRALQHELSITLVAQVFLCLYFTSFLVAYVWIISFRCILPMYFIGERSNEALPNCEELERQSYSKRELIAVVFLRKSVCRS